MDDSQRFLLEHFDTIQASPSHIYHSALPFCPTSSWLCERNSAELSPEVKVVRGLPVKWGTCSRTLFIKHTPWTLLCWKELIAVGRAHGEIHILDAITGTTTSILPRHSSGVFSLSFSLDGTLLVSGNWAKIIELWDTQTGGVIRTFEGHTDFVRCVSLSQDCTMIASGSNDCTIRLWDTQTGECCHIIHGHKGKVLSVSFFPTNSQLLMSASEDNTVQQWDINGCQIGPVYEGHGVAFSSDGTCFISWGSVATIRNSDSGAVVAELQVSTNDFKCCCFSPGDRLVAGGAGNTIYIWDITKSGPCLIETFNGHTSEILSLVFSSSLISSSRDE